MQKFTRNLTTSLSASLLTILMTSSFAAGARNAEHVELKFRALYSTLNSKQQNLPQPYTSYAQATSATSNVGNVYSALFGGEASADFFWNEYIAASFSASLHYYKQRATAIRVMVDNYNENPISIKARNMMSVPLSVIAQYHIAPFGAIRPYIGGGYHYTYLDSKTSRYKLSHGSGPVFQGGVDLAFKDDTYINFDAKKYMLTSKITYSTGFIQDANGGSIKSKIKFNPMTLAVGMGFRL